MNKLFFLFILFSFPIIGIAQDTTYAIRNGTVYELITRPVARVHLQQQGDTTAILNAYQKKITRSRTTVGEIGDFPFGLLVGYGITAETNVVIRTSNNGERVAVPVHTVISKDRFINYYAAVAIVVALVSLIFWFLYSTHSYDYMMDDDHILRVFAYTMGISLVLDVALGMIISNYYGSHISQYEELVIWFGGDVLIVLVVQVVGIIIVQQLVQRRHIKKMHKK